MYSSEYGKLNFDGFDAVLQSRALRSEDELVRPQGVDDPRRDEGPVARGHGLREGVHQEEVGAVVTPGLDAFGSCFGLVSDSHFLSFDPTEFDPELRQLEAVP